MLALLLLGRRDGFAVCNVIPGTTQTFRATQTTIDRPFASPGAVLTLMLDPTCQPVDRCFSGTPGTPGDQVVTVVFTPPGGGLGTRNVVVLWPATDCTGVGTCPGVAKTTCIPGNPSGGAGGVEVVNAQHLHVGFPNTDEFFRDSTDGLTFTGPATVAVTRVGDPLPCDLATHSCTEEKETLSLIACVDELFATDGTGGTTLHPTFPHFTALPVANDYQALCTTPNTPCGRTGLAANFRFTVDTAGNVLIPMDWRGVLVNRDAVPVPRLLRGSTPLEAFAGTGLPVRIPGPAFLGSFTPDGRKLPPIFDPQVDTTDPMAATFFGSADAPISVLRIARRVPVLLCVGGANADTPCATPRDCPGGTCTPTFRACGSGARAGAPCTCTGPSSTAAPSCTAAADCAGAPCGPATCVRGGSAGQPCLTDDDCPGPGGECGPSLLDFTDRLADGTGPVVVAREAPTGTPGVCDAGTSAGEVCQAPSDCPGGVCANYRLAALDPAPLDGLIQSEALNAFVMEEAIANQDLNGDGDITDHVVELGDRASGRVSPVGDAGAAARAVARIRQPPFSFPAIAVEGHVVAFLEPEPAQFGVDANGDGDAEDTILKIFRLGDAGAVESGLKNLAVDAAPLINGRSLTISNGKVFFRTLQSEMAGKVTTRVSAVNNCTRQLPVGNGNPFLETGQPAISADGRFVAFESRPAGDASGPCGIYLLDRASGKAPTPVSVADADGTPGDADSTDPAISADGRFVAFTSAAGNLLPAATGGHLQVFVRDTIMHRTELASVDAQGNAGDNDSLTPAISGDGRFVAFSSNAVNFETDSPSCDNSFYFRTHNCYDAFVHDRHTRATVRMSETADGSGGDENSGFPALSGDGRFVAYATLAGNLVPGQQFPGFIANIVVVDRDADQNGIFDERGGVTSTVVSVGPTGELGDASSIDPTISSDGHFVAFSSGATNLVAGDTNYEPDAFVHDRSTGITTRVSVASSGQQADDPTCGDFFGSCGSGRPAISPDGRFVSFTSTAAPAPGGAGTDVFVYDLLTGITSLASGGLSSFGKSGKSAISANGQFVVFQTGALDETSNDLVFVRGPASISAAGATAVNPDTVLEVLDTATGTKTTLCAAKDVAVAGGAAAFLRPETTVGTPTCPAGSLNGDADTDDLVVHLWQGGDRAQNLGRAALAVALSDTRLAALVSEDAEGHTDLNGDRDADDLVVETHPVDTAGGWTNLGQAADRVDVAGDIVAFTTPEAAQGNRDLNGDGDTTDRVLQVYDAARSGS
jgi:Tol biopolymer transport system component